MPTLSKQNNTESAHQVGKVRELLINHIQSIYSLWEVMLYPNDVHLRETVSYLMPGLDEPISWMSPHGFHVKAKPNQELATSFRQWDVKPQKWFSVFISIYGEN
jgi:hypothetical protein